MAKKYRPYFTAEELVEICACLKSNPTPKRMALVKYLERFLLDIQHSIRAPAYTETPRPTIGQKLGFDVIPVEPKISGEAAYQKQLINPLRCTPHEIEAAMEYRYLNDLMSPEEEKRYEESLGIDS